MQVVERAIAEIAGRQDNVITREQLLRAGLGRGAITHRVHAGAMQRIHKSVYLIGPAPPTPMARARAAALARGRPSSGRCSATRSSPGREPNGSP